MADHTPGPWDVFYKHKYQEWHVSLPKSDGGMRIDLFPYGVPTENPEGDAHLIGAAPALRAALEWIARHPCTNHYGGFEHAVVNDCHDYQKYLAEHPENWPADYLETTAAGKQMCDGCFARAALALARGEVQP